jgi:hypothetical protein
VLHVDVQNYRYFNVTAQGCVLGTLLFVLFYFVCKFKRLRDPNFVISYLLLIISRQGLKHFVQNELCNFEHPTIRLGNYIKKKK